VSQLLCSSRKKSIPTTWKVIGKELSKAKILEAKYEAKPESLGGGNTEKPSVEGVKIFSGTTHHTCNEYPKCRERYWLSSIMCR